MGQTKYQVTLAVDNKCSVSVQSDDQAAVAEALVWAQETYKKLHKWRHAAGSPSSTELMDPEPLTREDADTGAPICGIHQVTMVWVDRNGGFYSCHEKNADGSWCKYRPPKPNGKAGMVAVHG